MTKVRRFHYAIMEPDRRIAYVRREIAFRELWEIEESHDFEWHWGLCLTNEDIMELLEDIEVSWRDYKVLIPGDFSRNGADFLFQSVYWPPIFCWETDRERIEDVQRREMMERDE